VTKEQISKVMKLAHDEGFPVIPPVTSTAMAPFERLEDAGRAVSKVMYSGVIPIEIPEIQGVYHHTVY
jgi:hypothetical protein